MGDVSQRVVGVTDHAIDFSNVGSVVGTNHDGVQGW